MKPEDYEIVMKRMVADPPPVDYQSTSWVCSDKPYHTPHRVFYRMTSATLMSEHGNSHGLLTASESAPYVICAACGAKAHKLFPLAKELQPNTRHYTPGELVVYSAQTEEQRKANMMVVVGYTPDGGVKTRYVYEKEPWWAVHKKGDALQNDEFYENSISVLQPADNYNKTLFWLEGMSPSSPDYNFESAVNIYDLRSPLPALHPFWKLVTEKSLAQCKDDHDRRHGLGPVPVEKESGNVKAKEPAPQAQRARPPVPEPHHA